MINDDATITKKTLSELKDDLVSKRNSLGYVATKMLMDNNGIVNLDVQDVFDTVKTLDTKIAAIEAVLDMKELASNQPTQGFNIRQPEQW